MDIHQMKAIFKKQFPDSQPITISAPGRVNLIGEHTDYNDGFVLPMAVDAKMVLVGATRPDNEVHVYSIDFESTDVFSLDNLVSTETNTWSNYLRGMCLMFLEEGETLQGMNIVMQGNVPQGAGLSSSAALEVGTALLIKELNGLSTDPVRMVQLAQKAENEFVGVNCGIMDQFISMMGKEDHALFLDCRSLDYQVVPVNFASADTSVVVIDSGVKRGLVDSEYNTRRSQCEQAVTALQSHIPTAKSLRDIGVEHLDLIDQLPEDLKMRARHVVTENQRVLDAVKALRAGELQQFGQLMNESHESLRDDYEVSCPELDLLVEIAQSHPGTFGSRMTGAGFGGCTVSLVKNDQVSALKETVMKEYPEKTKITPRIFIFNASDGARLV